MDTTTIFSGVEDFRVQGRCLYLLSDVLSLIFLGVIANCDDFLDIIDFGNAHLEKLKEEFGLDLSNGIPSEDTLERIMRNINPSCLEVAFQLFTADIIRKGLLLNIDGKALRGTKSKGQKQALVQMVNVWSQDYQLSFGQQKVQEKSNEIEAIPKLINSIDCQGSIITIDAIACQENIIKTILENKADFVITLKANQGTLYQQTFAELERQKPQLEYFESLDLAHGRGEKRVAYVCNDLNFIDSISQWQGVKTIIMLERTRVLQGETEKSTTLYISSIEKLDPQKALQYTRNHWSIENQLHWQLDFTFREDHSRIRKDHAPENMHLMRKWSISLLKRDTQKISIKRKRKKASRDISYIKGLIQL